MDERKVEQTDSFFLFFSFSNQISGRVSLLSLSALGSLIQKHPFPFLSGNAEFAHSLSPSLFLLLVDLVVLYSYIPSISTSSSSSSSSRFLSHIANSPRLARGSLRQKFPRFPPPLELSLPSLNFPPSSSQALKTDSEM